MAETDYYELLACENAICRVNTYERGAGSGHCPGCGQTGVPTTATT